VASDRASTCGRRAAPRCSGSVTPARSTMSASVAAPTQPTSREATRMAPRASGRAEATSAARSGPTMTSRRRPSAREEHSTPSATAPRGPRATVATRVSACSARQARSPNASEGSDGHGEARVRHPVAADGDDRATWATPATTIAMAGGARRSARARGPSSGSQGDDAWRRRRRQDRPCARSLGLASRASGAG
jgi:hypothetical protein